MRGPGGPANGENKCSAASLSRYSRAVRPTDTPLGRRNGGEVFPGLPHSSGRSVEQDFLGGGGALPKWTRKKIRRRLLCSLAAPACQLQTRGRREIGRGRRERERRPRKEVDGNYSRRGQQRRSAFVLSFSLCRLLARSFSGRRKDQLQPAGGRESGGTREGGREGGRREDEAAVVPRRPRG